MYDLYAKPMLNSSMRIVNNLADAEDMVQEAFCDAFSKIHSYRPEVPFEGWLRRIVINRSISHVRKKRGFLVDIEGIPVADKQDEETVDEGLFEYDVKRVKWALQQLPRPQQLIFNLFVIDEVPQDEIATMLGISHANVRTTYHRVKNKIFNMLKSETYHEEEL